MCACAGEITNYRGPHSSGHVYFGLKDQNARLDAVIWKMTFLRLRVKPQEGSRSSPPARSARFPANPPIRSSSRRWSRPAPAL